MSQAMQKGEVTQLLRSWRAGDTRAQEKLWATYLRLLDADVDWNDRKHFFLVAARAMRFVLADEARRQLAVKRGQGAVGSLDDLVSEPVDRSLDRPEEVLSVHELLDQLSESRPRQARLVELRYFAGLSVEESADVLEVTTRTVVRDWRAAREWMHRKMQDRR